ncbi:Hypothetical predicted protein [Paramuricea clavata]|uniref:Uncharacterized protein n=1 Tax=Paramuricea clavata TaxID=317549 RepID=A0A7D9DD82_PARCT|nr:Hypothetical predicted protein [Paramuricea clavata]
MEELEHHNHSDSEESFAKQQLGPLAHGVESKLLGLPWNKREDTLSIHHDGNGGGDIVGAPGHYDGGRAAGLRCVCRACLPHIVVDAAGLGRYILDVFGRRDVNDGGGESSRMLTKGELAHIILSYEEEAQRVYRDGGENNDGNETILKKEIHGNGGVDGGGGSGASDIVGTPGRYDGGRAADPLCRVCPPRIVVDAAGLGRNILDVFGRCDDGGGGGDDAYP